MTFIEYLNELKQHSPYDFSEYSCNSLHRRILKIQNDHALSLDELAEITRRNPRFVEQLVEEITVNTTELFRDPDLWVHLYREVLPQFRKNSTITIWHAGCSSGQEVYSSMILFHAMGLLQRCRIFATDIHMRMLQQARQGLYSIRLNPSHRNNFEAVAAALWPKDSVSFEDYFEVDEAADRMEIKPEFRSIPQFVRHDLVSDQIPFAYKVDLLFCRNVLIYFNNDLQTRVVKQFHLKMHPKGSLVLGQHEAIPSFFRTQFHKSGPVYAKSNVSHFNY